jgi:hypothetical protein
MKFALLCFGLLPAVLAALPSVRLQVINQSMQKVGIFIGSHKALYVSPDSVGQFGVLQGIPFKVHDGEFRCFFGLVLTPYALDLHHDWSACHQRNGVSHNSRRRVCGNLANSVRCLPGLFGRIQLFSVIK